MLFDGNHAYANAPHLLLYMYIACPVVIHYKKRSQLVKGAEIFDKSLLLWSQEELRAMVIVLKFFI
jgi:hypothetical protein